MDVSSFLFHPPASRRKEDVPYLLQNGEVLRYTHIEDDDTEPNLQERIGRYTTNLLSATKLDATTRKDVTLQNTLSETNFGTAVRTQIPSRKMIGSKGTRRPPPISIPYIHIKASACPHQDMAWGSELCIILFHSNAEDIFNSLELARYIAEAFECSVIIPEYRSYSLLSDYPICPEGMRSDMLNLLYDINRSLGIDFGDMVLIVC